MKFELLHDRRSFSVRMSAFSRLFGISIFPICRVCLLSFDYHFWQNKHNTFFILTVPFASHLRTPLIRMFFIGEFQVMFVRTFFFIALFCWFIVMRTQTASCEKIHHKMNYYWRRKQKKKLSFSKMRNFISNDCGVSIDLAPLLRKISSFSTKFSFLTLFLLSREMKSSTNVNISCELDDVDIQSINYCK